jgi:hypothetical protein
MRIAAHHRDLGDDVEFRRAGNELVSFQRWVLGGYDKSIPWDEWSRARGQPRNLTRGSRQLPLLES